MSNSGFKATSGVQSFPFVSVCIPTYNHGRYIGKTLQSIVNQTYKNIEIIVCDNASTDNTREVVESFSDSRIKYYRNQTNLGPAKNSIKARMFARYEYIAFYHSDDIYDPRIVESELSFLLNRPEVGVVFARDILIDERDRVISLGVSLPRCLRNREVSTFADVLKGLLERCGSFFVWPALMARKQVFDVAGEFNDEYTVGGLGGAGDVAFILQTAKHFSVAILKERLLRRRISSGQGSTSYENNRVTRSYFYTVLADFMKSSALTRPIEKKLILQYEYNIFWDDVKIVKNMIRQNRDKEGRGLLRRIFSWRIFFTGFANLRNFGKLVLYALMRCSFLVGLQAKVVNIFKLLPIVE